MKLVAPLLLVATAASADPELKPAAKQLDESGLERFRQRDYSAASRDFSAAYDIDPQPQLLYAWAQSERLGGRCGRARELFARFLAYPVSDAQASAAHDLIADCAEPEEPYTWYGDGLTDGLVIGGVVGIGIGIAFLVAGSNATQDSMHETSLTAFDRDLDHATFDRRLGFTALALGTAAVGTGIALFVVHRHRVTAMTDGKSVRLSFRF